MSILYNNDCLAILPKDGSALYYSKIFDFAASCQHFINIFDTTDWRNDEVVIFGKHITTNRKTAWYGDSPFEYTYSHIARKANPWTPELLTIKSIIEKQSNETFNSCLLNLYHNGNDGMGWHSDNEKTLVESAAIASLSLGAERKFIFKHKNTKESVSILLENGSLLIMKGDTQKNWLHSLPKSKKITTPRINLTFRNMVATHQVV